jgi:hypothetical protein
MGRIVGILAIKNYLGVSESTVMDMIHNQGMPATKDELNVWEVDQARLDRWRSDPERDAKMAAVAEKQAEKENANLDEDTVKTVVIKTSAMGPTEAEAEKAASKTAPSKGKGKGKK